MLIRPERDSDKAAVYAVNASAFGTSIEADLVDRLRAQVPETISLVAEDREEIVGHILFSPVTVRSDSVINMMGLAPMAVTPACQRRGIGSALVRAGLQRCTATGVSAVVVLGHPLFYPRFGFSRAAAFGLHCEYDAPEEAFLAIELIPGALKPFRGLVKYHPAFSA